MSTELIMKVDSLLKQLIGITRRHLNLYLPYQSEEEDLLKSNRYIFYILRRCGIQCFNSEVYSSSIFGGCRYWKRLKYQVYISSAMS